MTGRLEKVRDWIAVLPSTNWQIFVATVLGALVVISVCYMMIFGINIQEEVLYPTFGFIASLAGVGAYQFKKKRETSPEHFDGVAKVEEAKKALPPTVVVPNAPPVVEVKA